ncbi:MAG: ABC transporter permease [Blastocatellia bacterium]|nr:ABC transporter permease [Blastocatellia bacterium]
MIGNILRDLRYSVRLLLKNRGFTAVAVLALALGIGANTAIFSIVNAVLLRPLPYENPDQIVMLWGSRPEMGLSRNLVSPADLYDWQRESKSFARLAAWTEAFFNLTGDDNPERVPGVIASPDLFAALGVEPALGRAFLPEEGSPGQTRVALLGYGLWQRRFGASPVIVGNTIKINEQNFTVVGVLPPDFILPDCQPELIVPFAPTPEQASNRRGRYLTVVARLNPGVTPDRAQAEMEAISARLQQRYPDTNSGHSVRVASIHSEITGKVRPALLVLLGAVAFVLLIACSNVANLLLARASARSKEIAIRSALGASRSAIIRQLLTESLLLAALGGIAGLFLAMWGVDILLSLSPSQLPRAASIRLDGRVLMFTLMISIATGLIFGLVPAIQTSRPDLNESLKESGRGAAGSKGSNRLRGLLVTGEVALAFVLLIGAGLMVKSFLRLSAVDPGIKPENVLAMDISLTSAYSESTQWIDFYDRVVERVESLPGVRSAGVTSHLPMSGEDGSRSFTIQGKTPATEGEKLSAEFRRVSRDYFKALGIPLMRGRSFAPQNNSEDTGEIIINQALARRFFPGEDPIGKVLMVEDGPPRAREIIGVVGDVKHFGLSAEPKPELYVSHADLPWFNMALVVRSSGDPKLLADAVRREISAVDKNLPVANVRTMEQYLQGSIAQERFSMTLLVIFAIAAMAMSVTGIYGVIAYSVTQRTREIGIRLALGAQTSDVLKMVVRQGMAMAAIGIGIGFVVALVLTRIMEGLLFEVTATNPATFAAVSTLLLWVSLAASYTPARRATKVDPIVALRYE